MAFPLKGNERARSSAICREDTGGSRGEPLKDGSRHPVVAGLWGRTAALERHRASATPGRAVCTSSPL